MSGWHTDPEHRTHLPIAEQVSRRDEDNGTNERQDRELDAERAAGHWPASNLKGM